MIDRDEYGSFLLGFIFGGFIGGILALLFAPQSGRESRELIRDKSIELRDRIRESIEEGAAKTYAEAEEEMVASEPTGPGGGRPDGFEA